MEISPRSIDSLTSKKTNMRANEQFETPQTWSMRQKSTTTERKEMRTPHDQQSCAIKEIYRFQFVAIMENLIWIKSHVIEAIADIPNLVHHILAKHLHIVSEYIWL